LIARQKVQEQVKNAEDNRKHEFNFSVTFEKGVGVLQRHVGQVVLHIEVDHDDRRVQKHVARVLAEVEQKAVIVSEYVRRTIILFIKRSSCFHASYTSRAFQRKSA
jgi:hypothetical protein